MKSISILLISIILGLIEFPCNTIINPDYSHITDPYARWQAYNIKNYSFKQQLLCYCVNRGVPMKIVVRDNKIVDVIKPTFIHLEANQWPYYKTVAELFTIYQRVKKDSVNFIRIEYDPVYGFPTIFYVDPSAVVVDEEFGYQTESFTIIRN